MTTFFSFSLNSSSLYGSTPSETDRDTLSHVNNKDGFNTVDFIFDHIGDSYEWHLFTIKNDHISIPLPVILYSQKSGLHIFMSSKFHHGHEVYKGFKLMKEGKYKGKIIEVDEAGTESENIILPINLSITKNVLTILMVSLLMCFLFIAIGQKYKKNPEKAPSGAQNLFEPVILFVKNEIALPSIGERKYSRFMPFLLTVFFFILFCNLLGLIPIFPGGANVTGNIAVTMVLALFTFFITHLTANKHYWKEIVNAPGVPWFLKLPIPILPIVEIAGMFTKPIVLMIRLFANILAGHMIAIVFFGLIFIFGAISIWAGYGISIVSVMFTFFMTLLELLVAFIQAYVFTLLSAIYFGMATQEHH